MFCTCELKRLRQLKAALLSRYRCETIISHFPDYLKYKIETCDEAAAVKVAEANLEEQKKIDAQNRKKSVRKATLVAAILSLVAFLAVAILVFKADLIPLLVTIPATILVTLIVRLIAKGVVKKRRAKNHTEILACEEALDYANGEFEAAKIEIEAKLRKVLAFYENRLNNPYDGLIVTIQKATVVHDDDKDYNTVCQIIWCFEHKYARTVQEAKHWIARANHSKFVRNRLNQLALDPKDDYEIDLNANEGQDFSEEIPQTNEDNA